MRRGAKYLVIALAGSWVLLETVIAAPELPLLLYQPGVDPQAFLPISYQCPGGKEGIVEVVKMNQIGGRIRVRVSFAGETPLTASVQRAWPNRPFEAWHDFASPLKKPTAEPERSIFESTMADAETVRMAICMGVTRTRERYDKILEHNRHHLQPPASD